MAVKICLHIWNVGYGEEVATAATYAVTIMSCGCNKKHVSLLICCMGNRQTVVTVANLITTVIYSNSKIT
jgi:hypothetical protein